MPWRLAEKKLINTNSTLLPLPDSSGSTTKLVPFTRYREQVYKKKKIERAGFASSHLAAPLNINAEPMKG
jgi:hypothetical protein